MSVTSLSSTPKTTSSNPSVSQTKSAQSSSVDASWNGVMKWRSLIEKYAKQYGVPANLVMAVMKLESGGQNLPPNSSGAVGPMQITNVWDNLGNRFNPEENVRMGVQILKIVRDQYPQYGWDGAIRSYFSGQPYPSEKSDGYNTVNQYYATVKNNWSYLDSHLGAPSKSGSTKKTSSVLQYGMEGEAVKQWQLKLVKLGYLSKSAYATGPGTFGPKTQEATKKFQKDHGLESSGAAGPKTQAAMAKMVAAFDTYQKTTLKRGMEGEAVLVWQRRLVRMGYLTEAELATGPGTFGPKTEAATKRFQADHGAEVSGVVGSGTRKRMADALAGKLKPKNGGSTGKLNVPYINQLTSEGGADDWNRLSNCGPTTMAMIAKAFGFHRDWLDGSLVNWLGNQAGVGGDGVGWDGVQTMASAAGLRSSHRSGDDVEWIRSELQKGHLVAANGDRAVTLQNGGNPETWGYGTGGHWIAVVGIASNGDFLVQDPSTDCKRLSPSELRRYLNTRAGGGELVSVWK